MRKTLHCWDVIAVQSPSDFYPWAFFSNMSFEVYCLVTNNHRAQIMNTCDTEIWWVVFGPLLHGQDYKTHNFYIIAWKQATRNFLVEEQKMRHLLVSGCAAIWHQHSCCASWMPWYWYTGLVIHWNITVLSNSILLNIWQVFLIFEAEINEKQTQQKQTHCIELKTRFIEELCHLCSPEILDTFLFIILAVCVYY